MLSRRALMVLFGLSINYFSANGADHAGIGECEKIPPDQLSSEIVTSIDDDVIHSARTKCYFKRARSTGNFEDCDHAEMLVSRCYFDLAIKKNDFKICAESFRRNPKNGIAHKENCLEAYAQSKKDIGACRLLSKEKEIEKCIKQVNHLLERDQAEKGTKKKTVTAPSSSI